ncbi:homing endonuclease associated repeat-containing protein [Chitinophaga rhizosphaerae]|uniref:homing endonuclease associated repeat-containing protein n=1 Tax=Chitinophaga rhizosphaerae TaxID=1864947 RepID=UPI000F814759|nr:HNH endonuclease [Chitinophaga rhizosphaerae]
MKYQLKEFNRNIPDEELLEDIKRIAGKLGANSLSSREYNDNGGRYTSGTIGIRFGSWNKALKKAGLQLILQREVSIEELHKNLEHVWIDLGRQPVFRDMQKSSSKYSVRHYMSKFGTWRNALKAFIEYINSEDTIDNDIKTSKEATSEPTPAAELLFKHKTKRFPSERLKVQVLMRDGNRCRLCGITVTGENIHFDHVTPWSKGGETTLENLQVLCDVHNLAKSNLEY